MNRPKILFTKIIQPPKNFPFSWCAMDFIEPQPIVQPKKAKHPNIIFTSIRGVEYGFQNITEPQKKNYYVVGEKAQSALKKKGISAKIVAHNAHELCEKLPPDIAFTYLASALHLPTLPECLGSRLEVLPVYTSVDKTVSLDEDYDAYAFFSPSGIESFKNQWDIPKNSTIFALGKTTAEAAKSNFPNIIIWPRINTTQALCAEIETFYKA